MRTIADSEETCINLATLSSRPERSAPLSRSPAASNTEDPEREIPGPPARPARTPAHRASRRTPARAAGLTPAAPPPRPSAMRHGPTRRSVLRTGRPAAATRRRGPWDPGRAGASGPAARPAARTAARTWPRTVGAAPRTRRRAPSRTSRPWRSSFSLWRSRRRRTGVRRAGYWKKKRKKKRRTHLVSPPPFDCCVLDASRPRRSSFFSWRSRRRRTRVRRTGYWKKRGRRREELTLYPPLRLIVVC